MKRTICLLPICTESKVKIIRKILKKNLSVNKVLKKINKDNHEEQKVFFQIKSTETNENRSKL